MIKALIESGDVRISEHGWNELEADDISVRDVVQGFDSAVLVEDYPEFGKAPSVLIRPLYSLPLIDQTQNDGKKDLRGESHEKTKYLHVGEYVAEVDVNLIEAEPTDEWGPYLSLEDAYLLDDVREFLKQGDIAKAATKARIFTLTPVSNSGRNGPQ